MQQRFCATALCGKASPRPPYRPAPTGLVASSLLLLLVSFLHFLTALFQAVLFKILVLFYTDFYSLKVRKELKIQLLFVHEMLNPVKCAFHNALMENGIGFIKAPFKPNGTGSNIRFRRLRKNICQVEELSRGRRMKHLRIHVNICEALVTRNIYMEHMIKTVRRGPGPIKLIALDYPKNRVELRYLIP